MDIMRCTEAFSGTTFGCSAGELVPMSHPMVRNFPQFFEPVSDFVARKYPRYAETDSGESKLPTKKAAARKPSTRKDA